MTDWQAESTAGLVWRWRISRYNPTPFVMAEHVGPFTSERAARRAVRRMAGDQ